MKKLSTSEEGIVVCSIISLIAGFLLGQISKRRATFFLGALLFLTSCGGGSVYWRETRHTATGRVSYLRPGWPADHRCSTYYSSQPVKSSTVRRLHFYRPTKKN